MTSLSDLHLSPRLTRLQSAQLTFPPAKEHDWRRLNWNLMRLFYEIVEHGGITAAARSLGRQQPATSQALSRLEQELGVALCRRGPAGFSVTPEGEIIFRTAAAMVELMQQASMLLSQADSLIQGHLRIVIEADIVNRDFDDVLTTILRRHRLVDIVLNSGPWQDVLDAVRSGEADIGLCYARAPDPTLVYDSLFEQTQQVYCTSLHPLYGITFDDPGLLREQSFFLLGNAEPTELSAFRRRFGLGAHVRGESQSMADLKRLIATGAALGFLPCPEIAEEVHFANFWPLLRNTSLPKCGLQLVSRPRSMTSLPAQTFLDEARGYTHVKKLLPALASRLGSSIRR